MIMGQRNVKGDHVMYNGTVECEYWTVNVTMGPHKVNIRPWNIVMGQCNVIMGPRNAKK